MFNSKAGLKKQAKVAREAMLNVLDKINAQVTNLIIKQGSCFIQGEYRLLQSAQKRLQKLELVDEVPVKDILSQFLIFLQLANSHRASVCQGKWDSILEAVC